MIAATTVAVIVGIAQAALTFWKHRKLDTMQWVSLILIVFFGGATILLKDNRFIMWKPTVLFWIGAIVMLFSHLAGKNGLKAVMGKEMQLPDFVWTRLTYAWIGFLIFTSLSLRIFQTNGSITNCSAHWASQSFFPSHRVCI